MYKKTINDHMTALGDVSSMFIVIEYNNPTYPELQFTTLLMVEI
jgi:hypothetical protein